MNHSTGPALRTMREALDVSLEDAAAALDRDPRFLSQVETGMVTIDDKTIGNIAGGLVQWVTAGRPAPKKTPQAKKTRTWTTRACERTGCIEQGHEWVDGTQDSMCVCANTEVLFSDVHSELITGYYYERSETWSAYAEIEPPEALHGRGGLEYLERLTAAFAEVQTLCNRLNAKTSVDDD